MNDKTSLIDYIKVDNVLHTEAKQISNKFGNHFTTIGQKIATKGGNSKYNITEYIKKIENLTKLYPSDTMQ